MFYKKIATSILLLLLGIGCCVACAKTPKEEKPQHDNDKISPSTEEITPADTLTIFVDAVNGSDEDSGTKEHPLQTIEKAQMLARTLLEEAQGDVTVYLREGTYTLNQTLIFNGLDSGNGNYQMIYAAYEDETAIVSGGTPITGWALHDAANNIWVADAKDIVSRDFFVNGRRAERARTDTAPNVTSFNESVIKVTNEELANLARPRDVEFVLKNYWNLPRICAEYAETENGITTFEMVQPGWNTYFETAALGGAALNKDQFIYAENAYEFLNTPGEWYLNTEEEKIYYIPREDEDLSTAETTLGRLEHLIELKGTKESPVVNLTFHGLQFSHTTWMQASSDIGLLTIQANYYKGEGMTAANQWDNTLWIAPSAAIHGDICNGICFSDNTFTQLGNAGIHLEVGIKNTTLSGNLLTDCAGSGIMLGSCAATEHDCINADGSNLISNRYRLCENNEIRDNTIQNIGSVYAGGVGIGIGYVRSTTVTHNTLTDLPYTAISFGWGWGFNGRELNNQFYHDENGKSLFCDNEISYNYIENIMNVLFDGGGIYTLGRNDNTDIFDNYINQVNNDYGAIYLDDGSCGFSVYNNVVANAYRNYIYKGDYNHIYDNYTTSGTAKQPDLDLRVPLVAGEYHYTFENNYDWDDEEVAEIRDNAGARK